MFLGEKCCFWTMVVRSPGRTTIFLLNEYFLWMTFCMATSILQCNQPNVTQTHITHTQTHITHTMNVISPLPNITRTLYHPHHQCNLKHQPPDYLVAKHEANIKQKMLQCELAINDDEQDATVTGFSNTADDVSSFCSSQYYWSDNYGLKIILEL